MVRSPRSEIIGVECKTGGGYFFNRTVFGTKTIQGNPRLNHLLQACIYLDHYIEQGTIKEFIILYISRDSFDRIEHRIRMEKRVSVSLDEEVVTRGPVLNGVPFRLFNMHDIYTRYLELDRVLAGELLPAREYDPHYSDEKVIRMYEREKISKSAYTSHVKKGDIVADPACKFCSWRKRCLRDG